MERTYSHAPCLYFTHWRIFIHHVFPIREYKPLKCQTRSRVRRWFYINRAAPLLRSFCMSLSLFLFHSSFSHIGFVKFRQRYATRVFISQCSGLGWTISAPLTYYRNWLRFLLLACTKILEAQKKESMKTLGHLYWKEKKRSRFRDECIT